MIGKKNVSQRYHRPCLTIIVIIIINNIIKVKPVWPAAETTPDYKPSLASERPQTCCM